MICGILPIVTKIFYPISNKSSNYKWHLHKFLIYRNSFNFKIHTFNNKNNNIYLECKKAFNLNKKSIISIDKIKNMYIILINSISDIQKYKMKEYDWHLVLNFHKPITNSYMEIDNDTNDETVCNIFDIIINEKYNNTILSKKIIYNNNEILLKEIYTFYSNLEDYDERLMYNFRKMTI